MHVLLTEQTRASTFVYLLLSSYDINRVRRACQAKKVTSQKFDLGEFPRLKIFFKVIYYLKSVQNGTRNGFLKYHSKEKWRKMARIGLFWSI